MSAASVNGSVTASASGTLSTFDVEHLVTAGDTSLAGFVYFTRLID